MHATSPNIRPIMFPTLEVGPAIAGAKAPRGSEQAGAKLGVGSVALQASSVASPSLPPPFASATGTSSTSGNPHVPRQPPCPCNVSSLLLTPPPQPGTKNCIRPDSAKARLQWPRRMLFLRAQAIGNPQPARALYPRMPQRGQVSWSSDCDSDTGRRPRRTSLATTVTSLVSYDREDADATRIRFPVLHASWQMHLGVSCFRTTVSAYMLCLTDRKEKETIRRHDGATQKTRKKKRVNLRYTRPYMLGHGFRSLGRDGGHSRNLLCLPALAAQGMHAATRPKASFEANIEVSLVPHFGIRYDTLLGSVSI